MDDRAFDRLARRLSAPESRREVLGTILGVVVAGLFATDTDAKNRGKRRMKHRDKTKSRRRKKTARAQAVAGCCSGGSNCAPGPGKNLTKCCYEGQDLSGKSFKSGNLTQANFTHATLTNAKFQSANLTGACFVDADLTGANLKASNLSGAIFCHTTMPDGTINDSGCDNGTSCCPTSTCADCPVDPKTGLPGFCCPGDLCSCGGICCGDDECWILRTESTDGGETPPRLEELCEIPANCVLCPDSGPACCTSCGLGGECVSSGPITGRSVRRRA
jgi:hypothetical protein